MSAGCGQMRVIIFTLLFLFASNASAQELREVLRCTGIIFGEGVVSYQENKDKQHLVESSKIAFGAYFGYLTDSSLSIQNEANEEWSSEYLANNTGRVINQYYQNSFHSDEMVSEIIKCYQMHSNLHLTHASSISSNARTIKTIYMDAVKGVIKDLD